LMSRVHCSVSVATRAQAVDLKPFWHLNDTICPLRR
jgi:hypothetical protein